MTLAEFAEIEEIDVSMTGFACRTADVAGIDEAWDYIKSEAGMWEAAYTIHQEEIHKESIRNYITINSL